MVSEIIEQLRQQLTNGNKRIELQRSDAIELLAELESVRVYVRDGIEARAYADRLEIGPMKMERTP
jgi:RecB family exonuclease